MKSFLYLLFLGKKPRKVNLSLDIPDTTKLAITEDGPGIEYILILFSKHF